MPRRGENIYKRKDGRWEGRYIRGRTPAGKAEYGYVYAKSYAACREKRRRMEDALPQKPMLTGEMSVCQAAEFFLSERRGALKASTIGRYEYMIRHYIVPEIGTILLRDLTAEKLSAYFKRLQNRCWRAAENNFQSCEKEMPLRLPRQGCGAACISKQKGRGIC